MKFPILVFFFLNWYFSLSLFWIMKSNIRNKSNNIPEYYLRVESISKMIFDNFSLFKFPFDIWKKIWPVKTIQNMKITKYP